MNSDKIMVGIVEAMNNIGLYFDYNDLLNAQLMDVLVDSMSFVSFIVELEIYFGIEIPDEYLLIENLPNIEAVRNMIEKLLN